VNWPIQQTGDNAVNTESRVVSGVDFETVSGAGYVWANDLVQATWQANHDGLALYQQAQGLEEEMRYGQIVSQTSGQNFRFSP